MLSPFKGITLGNGDATQRQIQHALRDIYAVQILGGNIIEISFPLVANTNMAVEHSLARNASGFIPVSLSAAGIIYLSPTVNPAPDRLIILRSNTASLKAKLWIF